MYEECEVSGTRNVSGNYAGTFLKNLSASKKTLIELKIGIALGPHWEWEVCKIIGTRRMRDPFPDTYLLSIFIPGFICYLVPCVPEPPAGTGRVCEVSYSPLDIDLSRSLVSLVIYKISTQ